MNIIEKANAILQLGEDDWKDMEGEYLDTVNEILNKSRTELEEKE